MKTRKHRQLIRVSVLGLMTVMLMSVGVMFFNTHASEAVSGSDLLTSNSDAAVSKTDAAAAEAGAAEEKQDIASQSKRTVTRTDPVEPRPTLARTANITFTAHGPNLGFTINSGSSTTVYVDWGTGTYKKETSSNGYFYNDSLQNSPSNIRISADSTIKSFISDRNDNSYLQDFDASGCTTLEELDVSHNSLVYTLDLSALVNLKKLDCSYNSIRELKLPHTVSLSALDCSHNLLRPSTIDIPYGQRGTYVPQAVSDNYDVNIQQNVVYDTVYDELAPEYKLTHYNADGAGTSKTTTFKWYDGSDNDVTSSVQNKGNGKYLFSHDLLSGTYYCVMTNPLFKDTSGKTCVWKTSTTLIVPESPSFTVVADDSLSGNTFYLTTNSDAQHIFVQYGGNTRFYPRSAGNVFAPLSKVGNLDRTIHFYAENLKSLSFEPSSVKRIELYGTPDLTTLIVPDNPSLTALDLSSCTKLKTVNAGNDGLTTLDLTGLTMLTTLDVSGNKLRFSGIKKPASFKTGNFSNQDNGMIALTNPIGIGQPIDLSAEYVDASSLYTWSGGVSPECSGGIATFDADDIGKTTSCVITHPDFPGLEVKTSETKIIPSAPVFTLTTSDSTGTISFALNDSATKVYVDFGSGFVEKSGGSISGTLAGNTVKVYAENVTSLSVPSCNLTGMDISRLTGLKSLNVSGNPALGLPDLSHCTGLTSLNVSGNDLAELDIAGLSHLATLDASGNKLKFSTVHQPEGFTNGNYSNQDNEAIVIAKPVRAGQTIDLSTEYVDGKTVFTWTPNDVTFRNTDGVISFGDNAKGKSISGVITHPDYSGLTVNVTGIRVMSGFFVDDDGSGVTAVPEDDITLEDADGNPIDIDDVTLRIRHLHSDEIESEKAAIIGKGYNVADNDILDGYDISLIDRNGRPVKIKGTAGIRITLPYGGIDRNENTFALYHNDSVAGIEKMTCTADEAGIVFVGHRFSAYTFIASPKASGEGGDDTTSSGGDTTPSGGDTTPSGGDTTPSAEGTIPSGDDTTSSEGDTTSSTGDGTSNKGNTPDTGESSGYVVVTYLLLMLSLGGMAAVYYLRRQGFPGGNDDMYSDSMKQ